MKELLCLSVQSHREVRFRFRFWFLKIGSGGSGSERTFNLQEGEGAPERGPQPGVFLEFLEPRLEPPRASIRASIRGPISP